MVEKKTGPTSVYTQLDRQPAPQTIPIGDYIEVPWSLLENNEDKRSRCKVVCVQDACGRSARAFLYAVLRHHPEFPLRARLVDFPIPRPSGCWFRLVWEKHV